MTKPPLEKVEAFSMFYNMFYNMLRDKNTKRVCLNFDTPS